MDNKTIAKLLEEIGVMIELTGGNPFSARAHYSGARTVESLSEPVTSLIDSNSLGNVTGIGKGLTDKITELLSTGQLKEYDDLKSRIPEGLFDILRIPGLGPKKVRIIYDKIGIKSLGELETACKEDRLSSLAGFGKKTQDNIVSGMTFLKTTQEQYLYHDSLKTAQSLLLDLIKLPEIIRADIAGSLRRHMETIKNIDIVASSREKHHTKVMDYFTNISEVEEIVEKGTAKSSVRLLSGMKADLRLVSDAYYPCALHYFTGSKEHTTAMRSRAKTFNIEINEFGLINKRESLEFQVEADLFSALGLDYIEPELRENLGEIKAAADNTLPELVTSGDVKGILHVHSIYSDGSQSIEDLALACIDRGYEYLGISDHSVSAFYANGLSEKRVMEQQEEIDRLNERYPDFTIFKGIESDILIDGSLDYPDAVLESFDFVVASVHSKLKMPEEEATSRLETALRNPFTTILGHPTGRLLLSREGFPVTMHRIVDASVEHRVILELNANPHRFDLDWRHCKYAKEKGVKFAVNPDAHNIQGLDNVHFGIGIARKGWLGPTDIINTMSAAELQNYFLERKSTV